MANPVTPAAGVAGYRNYQLETAGQIIPDVWDDYVKWDPDQARLITFLTAVNKMREVEHHRYSLWEERPIPQTVVVSGSQTGGDTTIEVVTGDGAKIAANSILLNDRTREVIRATAIIADSVTATRSFGDESGPAAAMNDGDILLILGQAYADGSGVAGIITYLDTEVFNYLQFFKEGLGVTVFGAALKRYGGKTYSDMRQTAATNHKRRIQEAFFFGQKALTTATVSMDGSNQTMTLPATGGLEEMIKTNVVDFLNTRPSWQTFMNQIAPSFEYGDNGYRSGKGIKHFFHSKDYDGLFAEWGWEKVRYVDVNMESPEIKGLGIKARKIVTPHGDLVLHPIYDFQLTPTHRGYGFIVDPAHIRCAFLKASEGMPSGKTYLRQHVETPGTAGRRDQFEAIMGLDVELEASHTLVKGLQVS